MARVTHEQRHWLWISVFPVLLWGSFLFHTICKGHAQMLNSAKMHLIDHWKSSTITTVIIFLPWKVCCSDQSSDRCNSPYSLKQNTLKNAFKMPSTVFVKVFSLKWTLEPGAPTNCPPLGMHSNKSACIMAVRILETAFASATRLTM